jgi:hypothetical protein
MDLRDLPPFCSKCGRRMRGSIRRHAEFDSLDWQCQRWGSFGHLFLRQPHDIVFVGILGTRPPKHLDVFDPWSGQPKSNLQRTADKDFRARIH